MSKFFRWFNKDKSSNVPETDEQHSLPEESADAEPQKIESTTTSDVEPEVDNTSAVDATKPADDTVIEHIPSAEPASLSAPLPPAEQTGADSDDTAPESNTSETVVQTHDQVTEGATSEQKDNSGFFSRLKQSLSRTKENLGSGLVSLFKGKSIDDDLFEELETQLLVADVGMDTTTKLIEELTDSADRKQLKDGEALFTLLREQMTSMLTGVETPLNLETSEGPFVILMVGVNGVGKTTTIGKLAKQFQLQGKKVMLAAGDTFRAAAVEQLQVWGERNDIPVVAQHTGADSASVLYDALQSAQAKGIDVLIADTAGRLQNKDHLMEELKKVVRVMKKLNPDAPHEVMLTLDAGTGQNAVSQAKLFQEAVGVTGINLTKLDGTAKGGIIFAIADKFGIPIRYIGIGEGIDDLRPFKSKEFVDALFQENA